MSYGVQLDSIFKKLTEMSEFLGGDKGSNQSSYTKKRKEEQLSSKC